MANRDSISRWAPVGAFFPGAAVTDNSVQTSAILDTQGADGIALILVTGVLSDADATFAVTLEHGDAANLSDAAVVADDYLNGTAALASFDFATDQQVRKIGYRGSKRYVRAKITPANNTGNLFVAGVWLKNRLNIAPSANPPA